MSFSPPYHQFVLDSGLRVVMFERPGARRFAATMAVRAGAQDDPPGMDGLAHLVEHLAFAGPNSAHVLDLARRGLVFNAETGWDRTRYTAVGHISLLEDFIVLLKNALTRIACEPETILKEMKTLQHEYTARAVIDSYAALAMRRLWGPILGRKRTFRPGWKNLTNLTRTVTNTSELSTKSTIDPTTPRWPLCPHLDRMC